MPRAKKAPFKVLFSCYPTAFQTPAGGEVQLLKTFEAIRKLGVKAELFDPWRTKIENFDILHHFSFDPGGEPIVRWARQRGVKVAISTIIWVESEGRFPWGPVTEMAKHADILLPNSRMELERLSKTLGIPESRFHVVHNGIDASYRNAASPAMFQRRYGFHDFVLCAARFDHRKNQLGLIRALRDAELDVVFLGGVGSPGYYEQCRREATSRMHFLGALDAGSPVLRSAYAACSVFVMPGLLETPGLAALEAAASGARLVVTQEGSTREYFGDSARYVHPLAYRQIRDAVLAARKERASATLRKHILKHFLWTHAGRQTLEAYKTILSRSEPVTAPRIGAEPWAQEGISPRSFLDFAQPEFQTRLGWSSLHEFPGGPRRRIRNGGARFFLLNDGKRSLTMEGHTEATGSFTLVNGRRTLGSRAVTGDRYSISFELPESKEEILEFGIEWHPQTPHAPAWVRRLGLA